MKDGHLESKDIMIGDWVMYDHNVFEEDEYMMGQHPLKPCKIESGEGIDLAIEGCFSPIPLTTDILEKNGWEFDNYDGKWENPNAINIDCVNYQKDFSIFGNVNAPFNEDGLPINYVHELQHALKLCGLTEIAENFQV